MADQNGRSNGKAKDAQPKEDVPVSEEEEEATAPEAAEIIAPKAEKIVAPKAGKSVAPKKAEEGKEEDVAKPEEAGKEDVNGSSKGAGKDAKVDPKQEEAEKQDVNGSSKGAAKDAKVEPKPKEAEEESEKEGEEETKPKAGATRSDGDDSESTPPTTSLSDFTKSSSPTASVPEINVTEAEGGSTSPVAPGSNPDSPASAHTSDDAKSIASDPPLESAEVPAEIAPNKVYSHLLALFRESDNDEEVLAYLKEHYNKLSFQLLYNLLTLALGKDRIRVARYLVDSKCQVNSRSSLYFSPLYIAIEKGLDLLAVDLVQLGAWPTKCEGDTTPLELAVQMNNDKVIHAILRKMHYKISTLNVSPLQARVNYFLLACREVKQEMMRQLVSADVVNCTSDIPNWCSPIILKTLDGNTPLHYAVKSKRPEIVRLFLKYGADVSAMNKRGFTPLLEAVQCVLSEDEIPVQFEVIADELLEAELKQAKYNCELDMTRNLPHFHIACTRSREDVIEYFIKEGALVNEMLRGSCLSRGLTALHYAILFKRQGIVSTLIKKGANVNAKSEMGWTPLILAIVYSRVDIVQLLLENDADVNFPGEFSYKGYIETPIKKFLTKLIAVEPYGRPSFLTEERLYATPLHIACRRDYKMLYTKRYATFDLSIKKIRWQKISNSSYVIVCLLVLYGADLEAVDEKGSTPLHYICDANYHKEMFNMENCSRTLKCLFFKARKRLLNLLFRAGVDFNAKRQKDWYTPLHCALQRGPIMNPLMDCLLRYDVNVNIRDRKGRTPLFVATAMDNFYAVRELLICGADINIQDKYHQTVFHEMFMPSFNMNCFEVYRNHIMKCTQLKKNINKCIKTRYMDICKKMMSKKKNILGIGTSQFYDNLLKNRWEFEDTKKLSYFYYFNFGYEILKLKEVHIKKGKTMFDFIQMEPWELMEFAEDEIVQNYLDSEEFNQIIGQFKPNVIRQRDVGRMMNWLSVPFLYSFHYLTKTFLTRPMIIEIFKNLDVLSIRKFIMASPCPEPDKIHEGLRKYYITMSQVQEEIKEDEEKNKVEEGEKKEDEKKKDETKEGEKKKDEKQEDEKKKDEKKEDKKEKNVES